MKHLLVAVLSVFFLLCSMGLLPVAANPLENAVTQDVFISVGDMEMGATLYRPKGVNSALPAIVTGHGSAPSTRKGVEFYTRHALALGFAVLSFDKRGTGASGGKYERFSVSGSDRNFRQLASDMEYAVRWLARQKGIDASRIGLFGGSQAGWIMTLAASNEPKVSFVIVGEGVAISAGLEALHGDIGGDAEWDDERILQADLAVLRAPPGIEAGYDPRPALLKSNTPTLWIFGLRDPVIPVAASIKALEDLIKDGKANNEVLVLPFGDHNFLNVATGERYDIGALVAPWLKRIDILK